MNQCGKMKILLSSLLFASLCTLSSWSVSSGTFVVTQSPDDVLVREGETVNITCCWTEKFERLRVNWLKNQTVIRSYYFNQPNASLKKEEKKCSSLNISSVRTEDSGTYICKVTVEIPSLCEAKGNGTVITVKTGNDTGNNSQSAQDSGKLRTSVIISLAVVVPLLLITLVCYCALRRKQALAARVIYEVPHVDSDAMDKDSTNSSLGSSQWRQVPLYESFYFEHVDPKESK